MATPALSGLYLRHAIKTGLACSLAYVISTLLGSHYPVWAVISAIVVMQRTSVAESLEASVLRFVGMAMGAVVGVGLSLVFTHPENIWWIGIIIFGINAAGAYFFRYGPRYMLASIAATIVLLVGHIQMRSSISEAALFGLTLIWEIALGVGVATAVSMLLWPVRLSETLRRDLSHQFTLLADMLKRIHAAYSENQHLPPSVLSDLVEKLLLNRERLRAASRNEGFLYGENYDVLDARIITINRAVTILRVLLEVLDDGDGRTPPLLVDKAQCMVERLAGIMLRYGETTPLDDSATEKDLAKVLSLGHGAMDELCSYHEDSGPPLHGLVRAHSYFRLLMQLAEIFRQQPAVDTGAIGH